MSRPRFPYDRLLPAIIYLWLIPFPARAVEAIDSHAPTHDNLEERVEQLEQQNRELRRRLDQLDPTSTTQGAAGEKSESDAETLTLTPGMGLVARYGNIRSSFQLFGNADFHYDEAIDESTGKSAFVAGAIDVFNTTQVGEHFQALTEIVGEGKSADDEFEVEMERLWGAWTFNDGLYLKLGREHSPLTRWDRLYHHGRWLWPAATAPFMARFEDEGGPLPIHQVGAELGGTLLLPQVSLEYIGVVSNGRHRDPTEVSNVSDQNESKAFGLSIQLTPHAWRRFVLGGNFYADEIPDDPDDPARKREIREFVGSGFLSLSAGNFEILGEGAVIEHKDRLANRTFRHSTGYLHAGYKWGDWTPYLRFDAHSMKRGDPYFAPVHIDRDGWEQVVGLRWDLTENVVLKLEGAAGQREELDHPANHGHTRCAAQLAWVF